MAELNHKKALFRQSKTVPPHSECGLANSGELLVHSLVHFPFASKADWAFIAFWIFNLKNWYLIEP